MAPIKKCGVSKRHFRHLVQLKYKKFNTVTRNTNSVLNKDVQHLTSQLTDNEVNITDCLINLEPFQEQVDNLELNLKGKLANWKRRNYITHKAFSELLSILHDSGLDVPTDCRALLKTPRSDPSIQNIHLLFVALHDKVDTQNKYFTDKIASLEKTQNECLVFLERISKAVYPESSVPQSTKFALPLRYIKEINKINDTLKDEIQFIEFKKCIKTMMGSLSPKNLGVIFNRIIPDILLLEFNWNGIKNKKSLNGNTQLINGIYEAIKDANFGLADFEIVMKNIIKNAKKRVHSVNYRRRIKTESNNNDNSN